MIIYQCRQKKKIENESNIQRDLADWAVSHNVRRSTCDDLLYIFNKNDVKNIPMSSDTLLLTPKKKIVLRYSSTWGILPLWNSELFSKFDFDFLSSIEVIEIDIGIDGLPLFKGSSQLKLWPNLGAISN